MYRLVTSSVRRVSSMPNFFYRSLPIAFPVRIVPQQEAWVVERLGKFNRVVGGGIRAFIPFVDKIMYAHSLKEEAFLVPRYF